MAQRIHGCPVWWIIKPGRCSYRSRNYDQLPRGFCDRVVLVLFSVQEEVVFQALSPVVGILRPLLISGLLRRFARTIVMLSVICPATSPVGPCTVQTFFRRCSEALQRPSEVLQRLVRSSSEVFRRCSDVDHTLNRHASLAVR